MGAYTNSRDAYASKTFSGQLLVTMTINFLINFLWQWSAMGKFSSFSSACQPSARGRLCRLPDSARLTHTLCTHLPPPQPLPPGPPSPPFPCTRR
jgi:hypothetical protein